MFTTIKNMRRWDADATRLLARPVGFGLLAATFIVICDRHGLPLWFLLAAGAALSIAIGGIEEIYGYLTGDLITADTVVICGSTRYMDEIVRVAQQETLAGHIVVRPECNLKVASDLWPAEHLDLIKSDLDELHRNKIALADEVVVVAPAGYIGESTEAEIEHARRLRKPVRIIDPWSARCAGYADPTEVNGFPAVQPEPLATADLGIDRTEYGILVCWIGQTGDALAITGDRRRGAAAIHALARSVSGRPTAGLIESEHARFLPHPNGYGWQVELCDADDPAAIPVTRSADLFDYQPQGVGR